MCRNVFKQRIWNCSVWCMLTLKWLATVGGPLLALSPFVAELSRAAIFFLDNCGNNCMWKGAMKWDWDQRQHFQENITMLTFLLMLSFLEAFLLKKEKGDTAFRDIFCRTLGATEPVRVILAPKTSRIIRLPLAAECLYKSRVHKAYLGWCSNLSAHMICPHGMFQV